jgi:hypothetical protein
MYALWEKHSDKALMNASMVTRVGTLMQIPAGYQYSSYIIVFSWPNRLVMRNKGYHGSRSEVDGKTADMHRSHESRAEVTT